jgi:hypothetical protein
MTEWCTHFDPAEFGEVPKVQAALLKADEEKPADGRPDLKLVRMPERETPQAQQRA